MKMEDKSLIKKRGSSLNESASSFEQSFSKITFRKRGHSRSLEMLPEISEKEDDPAEGLNQSNLSTTCTKHHNYKKKKKKKKKYISDEYSETVPNSSSLEMLSEICDKEDDLAEGLNHSNLSTNYTRYPNGKKKKKKKHLLEECLGIVPNSSSIEMLSGICEKEDDPTEEIQPNVSMNDTKYLNGNKKKKKHKSKEYSDVPSEINNEFLTKVKGNEETEARLKLTELNGLGNSSANIQNNKKKKRKKTDFSKYASESVPGEPHFSKGLIEDEQKNKNELATELKNINNANFDKQFLKIGKLLNFTNKTPKRTHLQSEVSNNKQVEAIDSPLIIFKKKKTHMLTDESILNVSNNEQLQTDGTVEESNVVTDVNNLTISQHFHSAKKLKKKYRPNLSSECLNKQHVTLESNNDGDRIKNIETKSNSLTDSVKKTNSEIKLLEPNPGKTENSGKQKKKHKKQKNYNEIELQRNSSDLIIKGNNEPIGEKESKHLITSLLPSGKSVTSQSNLSGSNLREINKSKKEGDLLKEKNSCEEKLTISTSSTSSLSSKDSIKNTGISLLKHKSQIIKSGKKAKDGKKNMSSPKKNKSNTETLRMRLLKEAFSETAKCEDFPLKPPKLKKNAEKNVDILRTQIPTKAFNDSVKCEDFPQIPTKLKKEAKNNAKNLTNEGQKSKKEFHTNSKDKNKKKQKLKKSCEIDKLTEVLISKALAKASSSGASHSSKENLDEEKKCVDLKKYEQTGYKTAKVKKHKSGLPEHKTAKVQEHVSEPKTDMDKIKKSLLSEVMKNLNPDLKSSKSK